ncbi:hypothetical protein C3B55_00038 [Candidatus Pseudomonas adelgestsugas]|uniref:Transposase DDE domain-containing protein n=1 Tax=Candidatus Pseudomonas adelgestsugas TaxID=1302376 RepID=A0ABX5R793_9PSED|nr:hypothetical protein C3B55_00038 [Candidatus Pseudomonas adelgestsugas]
MTLVYSNRVDINEGKTCKAGCRLSARRLNYKEVSTLIGWHLVVKCLIWNCLVLPINQYQLMSFISDCISVTFLDTVVLSLQLMFS